MNYTTWKNSVLGKVIGDGECVSLIVNNVKSYTADLFPGVSWQTIFPPVSGAKQLFANANPAYFQKIANDHSNASQLPQQGDVMVFDATPQAGYSNTFNNPYGHAGVCDSATANGYSLLQQNSPASGSPTNVTFYAWRYRPCIGWLRPISQTPANPNITLEQLTQLFTTYLHRNPDPDAISHYVDHYTYAFVEQDIKNSAEYKADQAKEVSSEPSKPIQTPVVAPPAPAAPVETPDPTPPPVTPTAPAPTKTAPPLNSPVQEPPKPKVVVVDPTYYKIWELIVAILRKLFSKK